MHTQYKHYSQPDSAFVSAGRSAFMADIPISNNPYSGAYRNQRVLWIKGYKDAAAEFERSNETQRKNR